MITLKERAEKLLNEMDDIAFSTARAGMIESALREVENEALPPKIMTELKLLAGYFENDWQVVLHKNDLKELIQFVKSKHMPVGHEARK